MVAEKDDFVVRIHFAHPPGNLAFAAAFGYNVQRDFTADAGFIFGKFLIQFPGYIFPLMMKAVPFVIFGTLRKRAVPPQDAEVQHSRAQFKIIAVQLSLIGGIAAKTFQRLEKFLFQDNFVAINFLPFLVVNVTH